MNYLKYIEHAAENLQFFMWHRAYVQKFEALPAQEKSLSPEWTLSKIESEALATQNVSRKMKISADTAAAMRGTGLDSTQTVAESEKANPFFTPPRTPSNEVKRQDASSMFSATESKSMGWESNEKSTSVSKRVEGAYDEAGLKWQPCESTRCFPPDTTNAFQSPSNRSGMRCPESSVSTSPTEARVSSTYLPKNVLLFSTLSRTRLTHPLSVTY